MKNLNEGKGIYDFKNVWIPDVKNLFEDGLGNTSYFMINADQLVIDKGCIMEKEIPFIFYVYFLFLVSGFNSLGS